MSVWLINPPSSGTLAFSLRLAPSLPAAHSPAFHTGSSASPSLALIERRAILRRWRIRPENGGRVYPRCASSAWNCVISASVDSYCWIWKARASRWKLSSMRSHALRLTNDPPWNVPSQVSARLPLNRLAGVGKKAGCGGALRSCRATRGGVRCRNTIVGGHIHAGSPGGGTGGGSPLLPGAHHLHTISVTGTREVVRNAEFFE